MIQKFDGYLAVPHELLHVLAYRIVGKKYRYQLGSHFVQSLETRSLGEKLFILLFPLIIIAGLGLGLMMLWMILYILSGYPANPILYFRIAPLWHKLLWVCSVILLLYSGSTFNDVRASFQLLSQKMGQKPPHPADYQ
jgi:Putative zincin peptidase